jgi:succinate-acetate transporter protein
MTDARFTNAGAVETRSEARIGHLGAMALWGFATGTWIAGVVVAGVFHPEALVFPAVAPVLIVFAGIGQFIGGLYSFSRSSTFAGTAFCSYGANNVVLGFLFLLQAVHLLGSTGPAMNIVGFELESFGFISLVLLLGAMRLNLAFVAVLAPLAAGFILAGIPDISGATAGALSEMGHIGGYLLIASAGIAYYTGAALVLNSVFKGPVLPLVGEA